MFCWKCGKENDDESKFCEYCGAQLRQVQEPVIDQVPTRATSQNYNAVQESMQPQPKKKTWLIILIAAIVVVGGIVAALVFVTGGNSSAPKENPSSEIYDYSSDVMNGTCERYAELYEANISALIDEDIEFRLEDDWYNMYSDGEETELSLIFDDEDYDYTFGSTNPIDASITAFEYMDKDDFEPYARAFFHTFFPDKSESEISNEYEELYEEAMADEDGIAYIEKSNYGIWLSIDEDYFSIELELY